MISLKITLVVEISFIPRMSLREYLINQIINTAPNESSKKVVGTLKICDLIRYAGNKTIKKNTLARNLNQAKKKNTAKITILILRASPHIHQIN